MSKFFECKTEQKKIGMLTPSSNTVVEPICSAMVSGFEDIVTMHYSRFRVTKISLESDSLNQFNVESMLSAAKMLADADVDIISWNGTSGGWTGLDSDKRLCSIIEEETGIAATTSMLAQIQTMHEKNVSRINMVTPYTDDINELIIKEYEKNDIEVINNIGLHYSINRSFSCVSLEKILSACKDVYSDRAQGLSIICTNFPAMKIVNEIEELGVPLFDTINTLVYQNIKQLGIKTDLFSNWGKIFK